MANVTQTQQSIEQLDNELNQTILQGKLLEAFDKFYAENVVMQENSDTPFEGFATNRKREEEFISSVEQFHGAELLGSAVHGNRAYSEWAYDVTFKGGSRMKLAQVAVRQWKDGKIAHERFYYNKG
ncbi:MAG TPA: nuclear transport factor 2 family protein [Bryobacteraceae bacterium]|nr:nuclear transport factor 2 family protein [Bryobacteraceae bacterium]